VAQSLGDRQALGAGCLKRFLYGRRVLLLRAAFDNQALQLVEFLLVVAIVILDDRNFLGSERRDPADDLVAVNSMPSVAGRLDRVSPPATCFEKLPEILKIPENWRS